MLRSFSILVFLLVVVSCSARAQSYTPLRSGAPVYQDTLSTDTPQPFRLQSFILPGSLLVLVDSVAVDESLISLEERHGLVRIEALPEDSKQIIFIYQTLPLPFKDVYRDPRVKVFREPDSTGYFTALPGETSTRQTDSEGDFFAGSNLNRSGSISRGVIAGNNRDVTIESGLRMQLSGEVVEGVNVRAALTDENTPILPEGTTQRLQELDKVFIEISTRSAVATLGDFQLDFDGSKFGRFSRKLQGASVAGSLPGNTSGPFGGGQLTAAGATSRGIFRSQTLDILEGVQGPYRLEGQFGERFIILIPGSEVVYLDGVRLTRGETNDYIIDYATAELTFTANRIIGADRRVVVEFQYSTNQFTRTLVASEAQSSFWKRPNSNRARGTFGVTILREADSRQFTEEFGLTSADSLLLSQAGDNLAARSGAQIVEYDPEAPYVQYRTDVVENGTETDTIFVAITEPPADSIDVFRVQFTRLGSGNGDYIRVGRMVNGIQYEYVGPAMGEYAPVRLLPRPKKQQLIDVTGMVMPLPGIVISGEFATSQNDLNRLSSIDENDDNGTAFTGSFRFEPLSINPGGADLGSIQAEVTRTQRSAHFVSFNRTRDIEFGRVWNLGTASGSPLGAVVAGARDVITEGYLQYTLSEGSFVKAGYGRLEVGDLIGSDRFSLETAIDGGQIADLSYNLENISTENALDLSDGSWLRQRSSLTRNVSGFVPRIEFEHERRESRPTTRDSLNLESFEFVEIRPGISRSSDKLSFSTSVEYRQDSFPLDGLLKDGGESWTIQSSASFKPSPTFDTDVVFGLRNVSVKEQFRVSLKKENRTSVVSRISGNARPFKRAVRASWIYDARTERTPRLQEIYIRTGPELGQYVWIDANADSVLQVDEFVLETTPNEGNYVRSFVPSDSLFSIVGVQSRFRLDLDPSRLIDDPENAVARTLRSISTRTVIDITEKNRTDRLADVYFLRLNRFRDPDLTLNGRLSIRQDVMLFKNKRKYGGELSLHQLRSLNNLATGLETKFLTRWEASLTAVFTNRWSTRVRSAVETDRASNESFASRNFSIRSVEASPELAFSPSRSFQINLAPEYVTKDDDVGARRSEIIKVPLEIRLTRASRYQLFSLIEAADVNLTGDADGLAGFELTDGRGPGRSYLWSLNGQYSINQYLRAIVSYDGRSPSTGKTIHTLRMQLSAVF